MEQSWTYLRTRYVSVLLTHCQVLMVELPVVLVDVNDHPVIPVAVNVSVPFVLSCHVVLANAVPNVH